jgi:ATP-dependent Clp protease, protease subunit
MTTRKHDIDDIHEYNIDTKNRCIYIHNFITGSDPDDANIDYRVANMFIKNINMLSALNSNPITIYLSSFGGCHSNGLSIFDAIKFCKCKTILIGHGPVCSMSTIITQAADLRILYPNTEFLIHMGFNSIDGTPAQVSNHTKHMEIREDRISYIYAERMKDGPMFQGKSVDSIKKYLERKLRDTPELYLYPDECVEWGLADGVFGSKEYPDLDSIRNGV